MKKKKSNRLKDIVTSFMNSKSGLLLVLVVLMAVVGGGTIMAKAYTWKDPSTLGFRIVNGVPSGNVAPPVQQKGPLGQNSEGWIYLNGRKVCSVGDPDCASGGENRSNIILGGGQTGTAACASIGKKCSMVMSHNYIVADYGAGTHGVRVCSGWYNQSLPGIPNTQSDVPNIHSCDARVGKYTTYLHVGVLQCDANFYAFCY